MKSTVIPTESIKCLALVKPGSNLALEWGLEKPSYGIYEYDRAFGSRELRWGDGCSQRLTEAHHDDLILLRQFGEREIAVIFSFAPFCP